MSKKRSCSVLCKGPGCATTSERFHMQNGLCRECIQKAKSKALAAELADVGGRVQPVGADRRRHDEQFLRECWFRHGDKMCRNIQSAEHAVEVMDRIYKALNSGSKPSKNSGHDFHDRWYKSRRPSKISREDAEVLMRIIMMDFLKSGDPRLLDAAMRGSPKETDPVWGIWNKHGRHRQGDVPKMDGITYPTKAQIEMYGEHNAIQFLIIAQNMAKGFVRSADGKYNDEVSTRLFENFAGFIQ